MLIFMSGCGIMMDGSKTKIHVYDGKPTGAGVYYNGDFVGYTPCVVYADKKKARIGESTIELRKEGYKSETIDLTRKAQAGYIVADVLLAIFPLFIDLATGGHFKVQPEELKPKLIKSN